LLNTTGVMHGEGDAHHFGTLYPIPGFIFA